MRFRQWLRLPDLCVTGAPEMNELPRDLKPFPGRSLIPRGRLEPIRRRAGGRPGVAPRRVLVTSDMRPPLAVGLHHCNKVKMALFDLHSVLARGIRDLHTSRLFLELDIIHSFDFMQ